jgi:hypothetical protein
MSLAPLLSSQRGALFGLDARIALFIFGILSIVAGVAGLSNLTQPRGQSLAEELSETTKALELIHHDLKVDLFAALTTPSENNAYQALFDNTLITEADNLRARWNGPYIRFTSTQHTRYGSMVIQKRQANHTQPCDDADNLCYLYVVYASVPLNVMQTANKILDGETETDANINGRLQWNSSTDGNATLYYRALKALTSSNN